LGAAVSIQPCPFSRKVGRGGFDLPGRCQGRAVRGLFSRARFLAKLGAAVSILRDGVRGGPSGAFSTVPVFSQSWARRFRSSGEGPAWGQGRASVGPGQGRRGARAGPAWGQGRARASGGRP